MLHRSFVSTWYWLKNGWNKWNDLRNFMRNPFHEYRKNRRCTLNSKWFFSHAHTNHFEDEFPISLSSTRALLFFLQMLLFVFSWFFCSSSSWFQCIGWQCSVWYVKVKTLALAHTYWHPCHTFSFSIATYVRACRCNSYSCGCATVFGIHQRIYRTNDGITYNFDFSATLSCNVKPTSEKPLW